MTTKTWQDNLLQFINNPAAVQRQALAQYEQRVSGEHVIVDPTNPFTFLLEAASTSASAAALKIQAAMRRVYPTMALNESEVYDHMSDVDYIGRFGAPARAEFVMLLARDEIYARAVETEAENVRQLTIPRNTFFTVAQTVFTMQYPIDMRIMGHEGLNIVYDTSQPSPLQKLETNQVEWSELEIGGTRYIRLVIPAYQFEITAFPNKLNNAGSFQKTYPLTGNFYHARAYYTDVNGTRREMLTTHSEQVFNPLTPTLLLRLNGRQLTATIPTIYLTTGQLTSEMILEVYTTDGPISLPLTSYSANSFTAKYVDRQREGLDRWSAPMAVFSNYSILANSDADGGTAQISFEELRERVINSAMGNPDEPITPSQLSTKIAERGYKQVLEIDRVTERQIQATRLLPTPEDGTLISGAGATMQALVASMKDLASFGYAVSDNGDRLTILPDALFSYSNGKIAPVPEATIEMLRALPVDVRARRINESQFLYSPFHYVLDQTEGRFDLRPYYLDTPSINYKSFVAENETTGIAIAVDEVELTRIDGGYAVVVTCKSGDDWKMLEDENAHCQLSFRPSAERDFAFQNGRLVGINANMERVYSFFLGTEFDLDATDALFLNTFQMYEQEARNHGTALVNDFYITFAATGLVSETLRTSEIDTTLGKYILPQDTLGLVRESINIRLGYSLAYLWAASRSIAGSEDYARYAADVMWTYEEDVFRRDPVTGTPVMEIIDGELVYYYDHRKGDPILDADGNQLVRFKAGEVQVDGNGDPISISSRKMLRQCSMFLIDGAYWFADDNATVTYRDSIAPTVVTWLEQDLAPLNALALENTTIFFFTQSTIGSVEVIVGEEKAQSIDAAQSFKVGFSVDALVYRNAELRAALQVMAVRIINEELAKPTVALNQIVKRITDTAGSDIIGCTVTGLGGLDPQSVVTMVDDSARLGIRRRAVDKADGTIEVTDDVEFSFTRHRS